MIIIISHRLSSIKCAYRVLVLKDEELVESGDRRELEGKGEYFSSLFNEQLFN